MSKRKEPNLSGVVARSKKSKPISLLPTTGDYKEFILPESFLTEAANSSGLKTTSIPN